MATRTQCDFCTKTATRADGHNFRCESHRNNFGGRDVGATGPALQPGACKECGGTFFTADIHHVPGCTWEGFR